MPLSPSERTARMRENRRISAREMLGGQCVVCGSTDDLEFDHLDPSTKLFAVADNWSRAWQVLVEEIKKCQLLCRSHHVQKTQEAGDGTAVQHGGGKSGKKGCKCDPCKARKRDYMREFMRDKRLASADAS